MKKQFNDNEEALHTENIRVQSDAQILQALQKATAQTRRCTFSRLARLTEELRDEVYDADGYDNNDEAIEIALTLLKQIEACFRRRV